MLHVLESPPGQSLLTFSLPVRMFVRVGVRWRHNQIFSYGLVSFPEFGKYNVIG